MIQVLSNIIVALYLTNLFILCVVYAIPHLQTKFKVSSDTLFKLVFMTILYMLSLVTLFYVVKELGVTESKLLYTFDGLLLFYLIFLYGWFTLRKEKK